MRKIKASITIAHPKTENISPPRTIAVFCFLVSKKKKKNLLIYFFLYSFFPVYLEKITCTIILCSDAGIS